MIYPHVQAWKAGVLDWVLRCRPKRLKTMHLDRNALSEVKRQFASEIWYRPFFDQQRLDNPEQRAREAAWTVLHDLDSTGCRQYVGVVSSYNEMDDGERLRDFSAVYASVMAAEGLLVVSYEMSVGQPSPRRWALYTPIPGHILGLHQYYAPTMDAPGWEDKLLRHVEVRQVTGWRGPIYLGETGIDHGVYQAQLAGWRAPGKSVSIADYCQQIRWYAGILHRTGASAAYLFNAGGWSPWETFEVADVPEIAETLAALGDRYYVPLHLGPSEPTGGTMASFDALVAQYGEGFAHALSDYVELVGQPLVQRVQIATAQDVPDGQDSYRFSHLDTSKGTLLWRKVDNRTIFIANDGALYEFTPVGVRSTW